MKCSQACCPFWVQLSVKFNVRKRTKKKHHAWEYKANHSFVLIFFPGLHGLKRKWLIVTMQQRLIWRGCTGACRKDANGMTLLSDFILISKCVCVNFVNCISFSFSLGFLPFCKTGLCVQIKQFVL